MKPPIPITDARFVYVNSAHTDIRKTFERARKHMTAQSNVKPITTKRKSA